MFIQYNNIKHLSFMLLYTIKLFVSAKCAIMSMYVWPR